MTERKSLRGETVFLYWSLSVSEVNEYDGYGSDYVQVTVLLSLERAGREWSEYKMWFLICILGQ